MSFNLVFTRGMVKTSMHSLGIRVHMHTLLEASYISQSCSALCRKSWYIYTLFGVVFFEFPPSYIWIQKQQLANLAPF